MAEGDPLDTAEGRRRWLQAIARDNRLAPSVRALGAVLELHRNRDPKNPRYRLCWASVWLMTAETGLDRATVIRGLKRLADTGYIAIEKAGSRSGGSNHYRFLFNAVPAVEEAVARRVEEARQSETERLRRESEARKTKATGGRNHTATGGRNHTATTVNGAAVVPFHGRKTSRSAVAESIPEVDSKDRDRDLREKHARVDALAAAVTRILRWLTEEGLSPTEAEWWWREVLPEQARAAILRDLEDGATEDEGRFLVAWSLKRYPLAACQK